MSLISPGFLKNLLPFLSSNSNLVLLFIYCVEINLPPLLFAISRKGSKYFSFVGNLV